MRATVEVPNEYKLLSSYGYVGVRHEDLLCLRRLGRTAIRRVRIGGEMEVLIDTGVLDYVLEIVSVYGHLLLAGDEIRKYQAEVPGKSESAKYHFYALVFNTKAFLDKIAAYLNWDYGLGLQRGAIDFKHEQFLRLLRSANPRLARELGRLRPWISDVTKWRDHLIHRKGVQVIPLVIPEVREYMRTTRHIKLPKDPEIGLS